ncbi:isoleucine--tRNA ligase [Candidatus Babeliales bacterium]|nr:isoleucine--tRNA ligase [Candidatus Babeliales bacterium]MBP9844039.1 isoleucine--tRNA ligase [Candidatus Babeliales bacterium]
MSKHEEQEQTALSYKDTLNLPRTDFPIRAQSHIFDPQILERWNKEDLYALTYTHNKGKNSFMLYDGPPYANGDIHLGHAYNKILKDIAVKSERMSGKHAPFVPLWDCHGLPIEIKVAAEVDAETKNNPVALKKACRKYAEKWVGIQKEEFKKLGVLMAFDESCTTMDPIYEAQTLRAFGIMVGKGYIARKQKTVPWCMHCQTVLANAEIEYEDRKDPSVYLEFPFDAATSSKLLPHFEGAKMSLLVWTTTPWTLPLNRAVVLKPGAKYQLVEMNNKFVILGKELVSKVAALMQVEAKSVAEFDAEQLIGQKVHHPFIENFQVPVIGDAFVSLEDGTACVHSAPGCGPDDYEIGLKNGLEIYSPLTVDGRYTVEIIPADLAGVLVTDGQWAVLKKLEEAGNLFFKQSIRHSYPHCWRCHNGLIFRATKQWFCDLSQHNLRQRALDAIASMRMIPETGRNRLSATVSGRLEWCLSRQRSWGVPIPAISCDDCNEVILTTELIEKVAQGVQKDGIEYWDAVAIPTLIPSGACVQCGSKNLRKEADILDVWFDSGVSHFAMLSEGVDVTYPADMYLEGKDQHRGWFQSSLLTSLALNEQPAMKEILTHGFTVDEKGRKMSKSIGNVVSPDDIVAKIGLDGLRLWVASNDYDSDPIVSENLMNNVGEVHRKIRNTCRFLLSNLYDFDIAKDAVHVDKMLLIDQYALSQLYDVNRSIQQSYKDRKTTAVFHGLADYCVKELSSFYLDIVKDRLYVEKADGFERRSAQTVCYYIVETLTKLMAPILSVTAELISDCYQQHKKASIHLQDFENLDWIENRLFTQLGYHDVKGIVDPRLAGMQSSALYDCTAIEFENIWQAMRDVRSAVLKSLEELRGQGVIKHSLDAAVKLHLSSDFKSYDLVQQLFAMIAQQNQDVHLFLKEYFIISQVKLVFDMQGMQQIAPGIFVQVTKAQGGKCARCWQWEEFDLFDAEKQLCGRCARALK